LRILYFAYLPDQLGTSSEEVSLPESVSNVGALLVMLRARGGPWEKWLGEDKVKVTVNRQFAEPSTPIAADAEIAIISARPF
jgi:molybdopterin converting factor small subunit